MPKINWMEFIYINNNNNEENLLFLHYICRFLNYLFQMDGATLAGKVDYNAGGVARNISDALGKLLPAKMSPLFISAIGYDEIGRFLLNSLRHIVSIFVYYTIFQSEMEFARPCYWNGNSCTTFASFTISLVVLVSASEKFEKKSE